MQACWEFLGKAYLLSYVYTPPPFFFSCSALRKRFQVLGGGFNEGRRISLTRLSPYHSQLIIASSATWTKLFSPKHHQLPTQPWIEYNDVADIMLSSPSLLLTIYEEVG